MIAQYQSVARFLRVFDYAHDAITYFLNKDFDARHIFSDDPRDFSQRNYGNNDVSGPNSFHGTYVAGIIAANQNNNVGINGVAVRNQQDRIQNWIEVGALTKTKDLNLVVRFSNYGKNEVDLFSPGFEIRSTTPENTYSVLSGTSMATPVAAGVGALVMSNFPSLTAEETKNLLIKSVRAYPDLNVLQPGRSMLATSVPFVNFSVTGGIINAYQSLVAASQHLQ